MSVNKQLVSLTSLLLRASKTVANGILCGDGIRVQIQQGETLQGEQPAYWQFFGDQTCFPLFAGNMIAADQNKTTFLFSKFDDKTESITLELWGSQGLISVLDVTKTHHKPICNTIFGQAVLSQGGHFGIYIAEDKKSKGQTFFKADENFVNKFDYKQNLGELNSEISFPKIFIANFAEETVENVEIPDDIIPLNLAYSEKTNTIYFVGLEKQAYQYGLTYMMNRHTRLMKFQLDNKQVQQITLPQTLQAVWAPKINQVSDELNFIGIPNGSLAHGCQGELWTYSNDEFKKLIGIIEQFEQDFSGIYGYHIDYNKYRFVGERFFAFTTYQSISQDLVLYDKEKESVIVAPFNQMDKPFGVSILDGDNENLLLAFSNNKVCYQVVKYNPYNQDSQIITQYSLQNHVTFQQNQLNQVVEKVEAAKIQVIKHNLSPVESYLIQTNPQNKLIMIVHGGPHGAILPNFSALRSALLSLNYNLLLVNFRGSIGFGDKVLRELPGNIGTMDLADVLDGLDLASNYVSIENTIVYGGSHGGFLGGHLVADERIKGGILLNGVYNCASMGLVTDIPDWVYYEGLGVDTQKSLTGEQVQQLYNLSPISKVNNVKCPVLLFVGEKDLRCPSFLSLEYFRALTNHGVNVQLKSYPEDSHPIQTPASAFDVIAQSLHWLDRHFS